MLFIDDSGYKLTPGQTQKTIAIDNAAGSLVERKRLVKHRVDGRNDGLCSEAVCWNRRGSPRRWVSVQDQSKIRREYPKESSGFSQS
jgi:hypothetical protein